MNEVLVHLPWMKGAPWSCCSTCFGGAGWKSQKEVQATIMGRRAFSSKHQLLMHVEW